MILVLDNIRSMHNIGSAFRTADAFAVEAVYLCGICATPPHREIQKTALGATETVPWNYFSDTLEAVQHLKSEGFKVIAIEQTPQSVSLSEELPTLFREKALAWVFGNEVFGVKNEVLKSCDAHIEIPQWGAKKSLNVSVAIGIVLWHALFEGSSS